jgi:hypothetical protein
MSSLAVPPPIASVAAVFCGRYGAVTRLAQARGVFRQTLYREAHAVADALDSSRTDALLASLRQQLAAFQAENQRLRLQLRQAIVVTADQQAPFASTAQALGVSLPAARTLLAALTGSATPSVATLGRLSQQAARRAGPVLAVLDEPARRRAGQVAADEIFVGRRPVLMTIEQRRLCWLGGRLASRRDGDEWAKEFAQLPAVEQVTRDGGQGMEKGLKIVNAQREKAGQKAIADQDDHFHILHHARRAWRQVRAKARRALYKAEKGEAKLKQDRRRLRKLPGGRAAGVALWWRQAEAAFDRWSAQEKALERLRAGLRLWTAVGELNTPERAETEVRSALAELTGPEWSRVRTKLVGQKAFTFLGRVQEQLHALPVATELREAAVQVEGLRRQPEQLKGESPSAQTLRGVLLASGLVLTLAGEAGKRALALVRGVLGGVWRARSLVEVNSVLRMQQRRQKRMTPGLLDLKRLYGNVHVFVAGRRKGQSPYEALGIKLPEGGWWRLLNMPPEQLRDQLSAPNPAA